MSPDVFEYVLYQLLNIPVRSYPFDHVYVENIFPSDYYPQLLKNLPESEQYTPIEKLGRVTKGAYPERSLFPLNQEQIQTLPDAKKAFWLDFTTKFKSEEFKQAVTFLFTDPIGERFHITGTGHLDWTVDLVRDTTHYSIGPHTDTPSKIITLLFYLPENDRNPHIGTALFAPKVADYTDPHGRHHGFEDFKLITTMPFKPNSMFGFYRSDSSWHGVAPIQEEIQRNSITFQLMMTTHT